MTTIAETAFPAAPRPLRLWPGIVAVVLQWVSMFVVPALFPAAAFYGIMGGPAAGLIVILWWLFFSRAPWVERLAGIGLMVISLFVTARLVHESLAGAGMGMLFYMFGIPVVCLALVLWAIFTRHLATGPRRRGVGRRDGARRRLPERAAPRRHQRDGRHRLGVALDADRGGEAARGSGRRAGADRGGCNGICGRRCRGVRRGGWDRGDRGRFAGGVSRYGRRR